MLESRIRLQTFDPPEVKILMQQFQDQTLTCRDCGNQFVWTASEQKFYAEKGFANAPVRCPSCRASKKASFNQSRGGPAGGGMGGGYSSGPKQMFDAVCSVCGKAIQVPFKPTIDEATGKPVRPIYCQEHYRQNKGM